MYKKQSHSHSSRKKVLLITAAAVLVLLIAGGTIVYLNRDQFFGQKGDAEQTQGAGQEDRVALLVGQGEDDKAMTLLDESIESATSSEEKARLYGQKATLQASSDVDMALATAIQAANANPSSHEGYSYVADLAERNGKTDVAVEYYQKTIDAYNASPPAEIGSMGLGYYEAKLNNLRAQ